jgi:hypothetical protein
MTMMKVVDIPPKSVNKGGRRVPSDRNVGRRRRGKSPRLRRD